MTSCNKYSINLAKNKRAMSFAYTLKQVNEAICISAYKRVTGKRNQPHRQNQPTEN